MAAAIKQALRLPVIVAGRLRTPAEMEAVLARGEADLVATARTLIADPDFPAKAAAGRADSVRPCISCNQGCWGMVAKGRSGGCVVNARAGAEWSLPSPEEASRPAPTRKRVLIVGGGPAGLEAARRAAERGHAVTLVEAAESLGGMLAVMARIPGREEAGLYLDWLVREVSRLGVAVRLGHTATAPEIASANWDAVVVATGSRPSPGGLARLLPSNLPVSGSDHPAVVAERVALVDPTRVVGDRVLVVDEDALSYPAAGVAERLAAAGKTVTIVTSAIAFGYPELVHTLDLGVVQRRLAERGVAVRAQTLVVGMDLDRREVRLLDLVTGQERRDGPWDAVVLATGSAAQDDLARELEGVVPELHVIGDALAPRRLMAATAEGYRVGGML
jgi:NADPH-dependent 2,4-dienoyl-CoA reductase/sulfur reductase-like enzyme